MSLCYIDSTFQYTFTNYFIEKATRNYALSSFIPSIGLEVLAREIKKIKSIQIWKVSLKFSMLADDMILNIENLGNSTKLLETMNQLCCRIIKIYVQKSIAFLYVNSELSEKEINKISTFTRKTNIRYLIINLNQKLKGTYIKNYKLTDERN